ncbi:MAG: formate dehydrogenase subunit delta [Acidiphilium sp.]|nr:formate dehydrogenase subunit delta [Acidiphilium sp.]MDD4935367.1 formate dehydrogenase subunit delta [Acidiphilium sp.]
MLHEANDAHESQDQKLVYMANQIATFFASEPDEKAITEIANHISKFWDPRMRSKIAAAVKAGNEGLLPRARAAIGLLPVVPKPAG